MEQIPIKTLIERCVSWMRDNGYTESSIGVYDRLWRHGILSFMSDKGLPDFTVDIGQSFLSGCHTNKHLTDCDISMRRSVRVLCEFMQTGKIVRKSHPKVNYELVGEIGAAMEMLMHQEAEKRKSACTLGIYRRHLWRFQAHLKTLQISSVSDIGPAVIISYVDGYGYGDKTASIRVLRAFFKFLSERDMTDSDLSICLQGYRKAKPEKIPSYYSAEEITRIEAYGKSETNTPKGRRNYAMLLLASRLGLRASDIALLKFENIIWDRMCISLKMYKTGKLISLPLLPEIGNAIIDYIQNGRPITNSRNVFMAAKAPYEAATSDTVQFAIRQIIEQSGVDISSRHHGPHSMRHSLASRLLENGEIMPVISESLGHQNTPTTMSYLKIDVASLRRCALEVNPVTEEFYTKNALALYENQT